MTPKPTHPLHRPALAGTLAAILLLAANPSSRAADRPEDATTQVTPTDAIRTRAIERGSDIVSQAGRSLGAVLLEAIRQGGVTNALPLCSVQAIPLTTSLAQANGVQLRRVSHRTRNPSNQADTTELRILEQFEAAKTAGTKSSPEVIVTSTNQITFFAPIFIPTNLCLQCHGDPAKDLDPVLPPLLKQLYPHDQATGFKLGDLRGLWRIDFPINTLQP